MPLLKLVVFTLVANFACSNIDEPASVRVVRDGLVCHPAGAPTTGSALCDRTLWLSIDARASAGALVLPLSNWEATGEGMLALKSYRGGCPAHTHGALLLRQLSCRVPDPLTRSLSDQSALLMWFRGPLVAYSYEPWFTIAQPNDRPTAWVGWPNDEYCALATGARPRVAVPISGESKSSRWDDKVVVVHLSAADTIQQAADALAWLTTCGAEPLIADVHPNNDHLPAGPAAEVDAK